MDEVDKMANDMQLVEVKRKLKALSLCLVMVLCFFAIFVIYMPEGQISKILGIS